MEGDAPKKVQYTCLIRLPFPRGDFVDPPLVDWDSSKDRALWKIISKAANSKDLDWVQLSSRFEVSLPFLLQQAAWLYERHFADMKAQMKKLGASTITVPSTSHDSPSSANLAAGPGMRAPQRPGSSGSRVPPALSIYARDSPSPQTGAVQSPTSRAHAPPISRTPSTRTVTQSRIAQPSSPRQASRSSFRGSSGSNRKPTHMLADLTSEQGSPPSLAGDEVLDSSASSSEDDDDHHTSQSIAKSQAFRRPPSLAPPAAVLGLGSDVDADVEDEDDESSAGFLPFATRTVVSAGHEDQAGAATTLPSLPRPRSQNLFETATTKPRAAPAKNQASTKPADRLFDQESSTSASSSSTSAVAAGAVRAAGAAETGTTKVASGQGQSQVPERPLAGQAPPSSSSAGSRQQRGQGTSSPPGRALTPKQRAELAKLSPRIRKGAGGTEGKGASGSDGTPSMGSSFSDLDDASVTQSALEDALLSNMQHGNMASRISTISNAMRSKYL